MKSPSGPVKGGLELVHILHFTAAWVVKALVSAGVPTAHPAVSKSGGPDPGQLRRRHRGPGAWDNGDLPIWMTFDAIEALRLANPAVPARPTSSTPW